MYKAKSRKLHGSTGLKYYNEIPLFCWKVKNLGGIKSKLKNVLDLRKAFSSLRCFNSFSRSGTLAASDFTVFTIVISCSWRARRLSSSCQSMKMKINQRNTKSICVFSVQHKNFILLPLVHINICQRCNVIKFIKCYLKMKLKVVLTRKKIFKSPATHIYQYSKKPFPIPWIKCWWKTPTFTQYIKRITSYCQFRTLKVPLYANFRLLVFSNNKCL